MKKYVTSNTQLIHWREGGREPIGGGVLVYLASEVDARIAEIAAQLRESHDSEISALRNNDGLRTRIAELESLLRRSWLKPAHEEPDLRAEVMKALGL